VIGIETEATLLARPLMVGAGKLADLLPFLEARGFELLQLKPIEPPSPRTRTRLRTRTYVNECDAVFCLRFDELRRRPPEHVLAALGLQVSYALYDEALALLDLIPELERRCNEAGVSLAELRALLSH
jgi:hypothetical protein